MIFSKSRPGKAQIGMRYQNVPNIRDFIPMAEKCFESRAGVFDRFLNDQRSHREAREAKVLRERGEPRTACRLSAAYLLSRCRQASPRNGSSARHILFSVSIAGNPACYRSETCCGDGSTSDGTVFPGSRAALNPGFDRSSEPIGRNSEAQNGCASSRSLTPPHQIKHHAATR